VSGVRSVSLPAHRIALAVGEPFEAGVLALLEAASMQVAGRPCTVTRFCSSVRELREAVAHTDTVDIVVMSSTLQALPVTTVRELVQTGRPVVVLVPNLAAPVWADLTAPVLGLDADGPALQRALSEALLGQRTVAQSTGGNRSKRAATRNKVDRTREHRPAAITTSERGEVITVSSAEIPDGRTAAVAVPLAYALSFAEPTVLLDVNSRGGAIEFHLPLDPARGLPQLGRRTHEPDGSWSQAFADEDAWRAALESELQPIGSSSQGWAACGITTPAYARYLSEDLLERTIATLRGSHRFLVLDSSGGGWKPGDSAVDRAALLAADHLLVVLRPDEQGIERTRRLLNTWPHRERISLILNQVGLPGTDEAVGSIEYLLGAPVAASLPFDPQHLATARLHQRPVICEPGCRLSEPLLDLAARLAGGGPIRLPSRQPSRSPSPWRRVAALATGLLR
jgi:Flp pilus assembly CpaE family ATPase